MLLKTKIIIKNGLGYLIKKYRYYSFNPRKIKKVLINMVSASNGLGDIVLVTSLVQAIKQTFNNPEIYFLVRKHDFNKIVRFFPEKVNILTADLDDNDSFISCKYVCNEIKPLGIDLVIHGYLESWTDCSLMVKSGKIPFSIGPYRNAGGKLMDMNTFSFVHNASLTHPYINNKSFYDYIGLNKPFDVCLKFASKDNMAGIKLLMKDFGMSKDDIILGIHPGCTAKAYYKRWPAERFCKVANDFCDISIKHKVLIFGGYEDVDAINQLENIKYSDRIKIVRNEDILNVLALVRQCALFICNDSGLMHLAAAVNIPTIAIFGPTSAEEHKQVYNGLNIIEKPLGCRPCYNTKHLTECLSGERTNPLCMDSISTNMVFEKILDVLNIKTCIAAI